MCYRVCVGKHMKEREDAGRFMQHQDSCKHLQCEKMKNRLTPNMKHNRKDAPKLPDMQPKCKHPETKRESLALFCVCHVMSPFERPSRTSPKHQKAERKLELW